MEFRGLDLDTVRFPDDEDHLILNDYPRLFDRLLQTLMGREDSASRRLAAVLGNRRKWADQKQTGGVLNRNDLLEIGGEQALKWVLDAIDLSIT